MRHLIECVIFAIVLFGSCIIGLFGWAQIIGCLQHFRMRGPKMSILTIVLWIAILGVVCFLVHYFLYTYRIVYYIGTGLALLLILFAGEMK